MAETFQNHTVISGDVKEAYLKTLDNALECAAADFRRRTETKYPDEVVAFGKDWDFSRLPERQSLFPTIASLLERVREEYCWFSYETSAKPNEQYGYFDELSINKQTGLPWQFDFIELHRLKREAPKLLERQKGYDVCVGDLKALLLSDNVGIADVSKRADKIHHSAMQRAFFERLIGKKIAGWEADDQTQRPGAVMVSDMGAEALWNIQHVFYSRAQGIFHAYVIDAWQDREQPQIAQDGGVSNELAKFLNFADDNSAWYMLKSIDDSFKSLHPVHITRVVVGPFENEYRTNPVSMPFLAGVKGNRDNPMLRLTMQYSFAPNHVVGETSIRQVIRQEDFSDEIIVAPAKCVSQVAQSVLGNKVRVVGM